MMIESMAGKSASLNGLAYDATPFTFSEEDPAIDYFGNLLKQCKVFPSAEFEFYLHVPFSYHRRLSL